MDEKTRRRVRLFELDPNGLVPLVNQVDKLTTTLAKFRLFDCP
jgi:hypothetical protein